MKWEGIEIQLPSPTNRLKSQFSRERFIYIPRFSNQHAVMYSLDRRQYGPISLEVSLIIIYLGLVCRRCDRREFLSYNFQFLLIPSHLIQSRQANGSASIPAVSTEQQVLRLVFPNGDIIKIVHGDTSFSTLYIGVIKEETARLTY